MRPSQNTERGKRRREKKPHKQRSFCWLHRKPNVLDSACWSQHPHPALPPSQLVPANDHPCQVDTSLGRWPASSSCTTARVTCWVLPKPNFHLSDKTCEPCLCSSTWHQPVGAPLTFQLTVFEDLRGVTAEVLMCNQTGLFLSFTSCNCSEPTREFSKKKLWDKQSRCRKAEG